MPKLNRVRYRSLGHSPPLSNRRAPVHAGRASASVLSITHLTHHHSHTVTHTPSLTHHHSHSIIHTQSFTQSLTHHHSNTIAHTPSLTHDPSPPPHTSFEAFGVASYGWRWGHVCPGPDKTLALLSSPHTHQLVKQATNQSTNQPTNQSTNQPINHPINQPTNQTSNQPINQTTN